MGVPDNGILVNSVFHVSLEKQLDTRGGVQLLLVGVESLPVFKTPIATFDFHGRPDPCLPRNFNIVDLCGFLPYTKSYELPYGTVRDLDTYSICVKSSVKHAYTASLTSGTSSLKFGTTFISFIRYKQHICAGSPELCCSQVTSVVPKSNEMAQILNPTFGN